MRKHWIALCLVLCLALGLTACGAKDTQGQADGSSVSAGQQASRIAGMVLDATEDTLILRADSGVEYVMDLYGAEIRVEGGLVAGMRVDVAYEGELAESGPKPHVLTVSALESTETDLLHTGSTVDGSVLEAGGSRLTIRTAAGRRCVFETVKASRFEEHQWVRVTYDGDLSAGNTVVQDVTLCTDLPDCYQVKAGRRRYDQETDILQFRTQAGVDYEADLAYVETNVPAGFDARTQLTVYYQAAGRSEERAAPAPIRVVKVEDSRFTGASRLQATVESWDEDSGALTVHTDDGRVLTVWVWLSQLQGEAAEDGLQAGDGVCLYYTGSVEGSDVSRMDLQQVERTAKAAEHRSSVAGEVQRVEKKGLVLETDDGRTLRFARTESSDSLPDGLETGDWVRVEYTGWLGTEEDSADASRAVLARVALAVR